MIGAWERQGAQCYTCSSLHVLVECWAAVPSAVGDLVVVGVNVGSAVGCSVGVWLGDGDGECVVGTSVGVRVG